MNERAVSKLRVALSYVIDQVDDNLSRGHASGDKLEKLKEMNTEIYYNLIGPQPELPFARSTLAFHVGSLLGLKIIEDDIAFVLMALIEDK